VNRDGKQAPGVEARLKSRVHPQSLRTTRVERHRSLHQALITIRVAKMQTNDGVADAVASISQDKPDARKIRRTDNVSDAELVSLDLDFTAKTQIGNGRLVLCMQRRGDHGGQDRGQHYRHQALG
jgi:hypothetical protein